MAEKKQPPQHQEHQPGTRDEMQPKPKTGEESYRGSGKLTDKVAILTGGDSGIGRAVAEEPPRYRPRAARAHLSAPTSSRISTSPAPPCSTCAKGAPSSTRLGHRLQGDAGADRLLGIQQAGATLAFFCFQCVGHH